MMCASFLHSFQSMISLWKIDRNNCCIKYDDKRSYFGNDILSSTLSREYLPLDDEVKL